MMASVRNYDGIIGQNQFSTTSTWYKIGFEDGQAGREWKCCAAGENAHALIDYDAGYNAGRSEPAK